MEEVHQICSMDVDQDSEPSEPSHMEALPDEVLEKIFSYLTLELLSILDVVCSRWSFIIIRRFFHPYLASKATKEFSVAKQLSRQGWSPRWDPRNNQIYKINRKLFDKVTHDVPNAWSESIPSIIESDLWNFKPETNDRRATAMAVYKDKLYVGRATCEVEVWCLNSFSLRTVLNDDNEPGPGHITKSCELALHGSTLAVSCPSRTKVKLFNTEADEMVGQIESKIGPIYKIVISDRLLICLSGWSLLVWKIDSSQPGMVRGVIKGVFPDYQSTAEFSNWLEVHSAVINQNWLVTHATRLTSGPHLNPRQRTVCFLQIRRVGPDGHLGPILRPDQSAMSRDVKELNCLALSDQDLLAYLVMIKVGNDLRYVIKVMNVSSGDEIASIPSLCPSILGSVQMPVAWKGEHLYMKLVPKLLGPTQPGISTVSMDNSDSDDISLARWSCTTHSLTAVPGVKITSNNDKLLVEEARLVQLSTRLIKKEYVEDSDDDDEDEEEDGSLYLVSAKIYDFWNVMEE